MSWASWFQTWTRRRAAAIRNAGVNTRRSRRPLVLEQLEDRTLPSANPLLLDQTVVDQLSAFGEIDQREITLVQPGLLRISVAGVSGGLDTRASLVGGDGELLIQSEGQTPDDRTDLIEQHLSAGTYLVRIESANARTGAYELAATFAAAAPPFEQIPLGTSPVTVVLADFDGDGALDMATANIGSNDVSILTGVGDGTFLSQQRRFTFGAAPTALAVGDFNGDDELDLVVTSSATANNVRVLLGAGDGSFTVLAPQTAGPAVTAVALGDFNGDQVLDLAVAHNAANSVSVLLGTGDGRFTKAAVVGVGLVPRAIVVGDFNQDGCLDFVTANNGATTREMSLVLGRGDGTFANAVAVLGDAPAVNVVAADFDGDGDLDLASTNLAAFTVSIFLNDGQGRFSAPTKLTAGRRPSGIKTGDFNGDGKVDLAVANLFSADVSIFLSNGDGTFKPQAPRNIGLSVPGHMPVALAVGDLDGDGRLDLATANGVQAALVPPNSLSVLLGRGDGTLHESRDFAVGDGPQPPVIADLNGDGQLDLVVPNVGSNDVSILLGLSDGTFQAERRLAVAEKPSAVVVGDFNEDGRLDIATASSAPNGRFISILLGIGNGDFQAERRVEVGLQPYILASVDLNGDGHLDLATINRLDDSVSVAFGRGDGSFDVHAPIQVGVQPQALATADLNRDGVVDLVVTNAGWPLLDTPTVLPNGSVTIVLGRRDLNAPNHWSPETLSEISAGVNVGRVLVDDVNGDGALDVIAVNHGVYGAVSNTISIFLSGRDASNAWTLLPEERYTVVESPSVIAAADVNGDGRMDLLVGSEAAGAAEASILLSTPGGARPFAAERRIAVPGPAKCFAISDFNGDGKLDIAYVRAIYGGVTAEPNIGILFGDGAGAFQLMQTIFVNSIPSSLQIADFNGDAVPDLVSSNLDTDDVSVLLGLGDGTFAPSISTVNPIRSVPLAADLNADGVQDLVVLNNNGRILFRAGRAGQPGVYAPPLVVNPGETAAARDVTLMQGGSSVVLAALDASGGGVSLYSFAIATGAFQRTDGPDVQGSLPARLAAGDLNRDGRDDLVVAAPGRSVVEVYLRAANGAFTTQPSYVIDVGANPTTVQLADVDGNGWLDIVAANQFSADVSVVLNGPNGLAAQDRRFRAGVGLYSMDRFGGDTTVHALQSTIGLATGDFDGDGVLDVVVANKGANNLMLLRGSGHGGLLDPVQSQAVETSKFPTMVVAADFNGDRFLDLAVLCEGSNSVAVLLGDGRGGFTASSSAAAGNVPTGLALGDVNGDGRVDLLIGNQFGDVLVLSGNGDGSFEAYRRTERSVSLAVADLDGDGQRDFVLANESLDRVVVQYGRSSDAAPWQSGAGILGPEAVKTTDVNGDGLLDLLVSNGGGNDLLVYLGLGNGQFGAAQSFFTGTKPAQFTVADLDGNGWLDVVVANEGSNDVSVLLGEGVRAADGSVAGWKFTYGPRLNAGYDAVTGAQLGLGPVATAVADVTGDGVLDVLVTNRASNNVALLAGIGNGFFLDQQPQLFGVGLDPRQVLVGDFDGRPGVDFLTINAGANSITFFSGSTGRGVEIGTGGLRPVAAFSGDFNDDGLSDLVVAHNGNGLFALLVGTPTGLEVAAGLTDVHVQHPTDLALAAQRNGVIELFACEEGRESVFFLTFDFRPDPVTPELVPLRDAELAAVAIFVAGAGGEGLGEGEATAPEAAPAFQAFVVGLDNYPVNPDGGRSSDEGASVASIEIMDHIFRNLVQPVGTEVVHAAAMLLDSSLAAFASVTGPLNADARAVGRHWENMFRDLLARAEPQVLAPSAEPSADADVAAMLEISESAPLLEDRAAAPRVYWGVQTPIVVVFEVTVSLFGIWLLDRRRRSATLPAMVRRPQE